MVLEHPRSSKYLADFWPNTSIGSGKNGAQAKKPSGYCCTKSTKGGWRSLLSSDCHNTKGAHQPVGVWFGLFFCI